VHGDIASGRALDSCSSTGRDAHAPVAVNLTAACAGQKEQLPKANHSARSATAPTTPHAQ